MVFKSVGVRHPTLYVGSQIENPKNGYLFFTWGSYEAHLRVMNHASYLDVIAILQPCQGRKIQMYHVQFSAPTIAFEKPVTEVLVLTLRAPENRATVVDILSKLSEASQKILVFGQTVEDKNKYIVVGGWPTVEAQWEIVAKPDVAAALTRLYSLATKDHLYHTKLAYHQL